MYIYIPKYFSTTTTVTGLVYIKITRIFKNSQEFLRILCILIRILESYEKETKNIFKNSTRQENHAMDDGNDS